jgi:putative FmdB family regulatory protein
MSKLILFDFACTKCGNVFEELTKSDNKELPCPNCKYSAIRIISGTRLDPNLAMDGGFPTMVDRWAKKQAQRAKVDNIDGPNLWMY